MHKSFFGRIPVPLSGVMLSFAALGNFIKNYSRGAWLFCEIIAAILFVTLILKAIVTPDDIKAALSDPALSGIICTFSMGTLFFSVSLAAISTTLGRVFWIAAVALHFFFMGNYTARFIRYFKWEQLDTASFLIYVGIAAAAATSVPFGFGAFGTALLIFATIAMVILFPMTIYHYATQPSPEAAQPLICMFAAPLSLCLVAYFQVSAVKNVPLVIISAIITVGLYIFALSLAIRFIARRKFYPSFSAFTFPFVNTAIAAFGSSAVFKAAGLAPLSSVFHTVATIEMIIAAALLIFVFVCYLRVIVITPLQQTSFMRRRNYAHSQSQKSHRV